VAEKLTLRDPESGKSLDLPVVTGTEGDPTLDISSAGAGLNRRMYALDTQAYGKVSVEIGSVIFGSALPAGRC